jgi:hypothetical protein
VSILNVLKVVCFHALLQVLIAKELDGNTVAAQERKAKPRGQRRADHNSPARGFGDPIMNVRQPGDWRSGGTEEQKRQQ